MNNNVIFMVNDEGYKALGRIALDKPELFLLGDTCCLRNEMAAINGSDKLWAKPIELKKNLDRLNNVRIEGHQTDAEFAPILREALREIPNNQLADERFWLSINCFALAKYVPKRWETSNLQKPDSKLYRFINKHYFKFDRQGNAAMRLWWLGEIAERVAKHTEYYSSAGVMELMSQNLDLYHITLSSPYLLAIPKLNALIWEAAREDDYLFKRPYPSQLFKSLNERASTISLDLLDEKQLRELVREATPVPKV